MQSLIPQFHLSGGFIILGVVALLLAGVAVMLMSGRKPWLARIQPKALMTDNEKAFFLRLERALPHYRVLPQVAFAAFLTDDGKLNQQKRWAVRARFDRKIADFLICERDSINIVAIVELDDRMHVPRADRARDELTKAAGYKTIRFQSRQKPTEAEIAALFRHSGALAVSALPQKRTALSQAL